MNSNQKTPGGGTEESAGAESELKEPGDRQREGSMVVVGFTKTVKKKGLKAPLSRKEQVRQKEGGFRGGVCKHPEGVKKKTVSKGGGKG